MVSGMLVLVPVGVTLLVMRWLFTWVTSLLRPAVKYATSSLERLHWIQALPFLRLCLPLFLPLDVCVARTQPQ